jgi:hypothetical protein
VGLGKSCRGVGLGGEEGLGPSGVSCRSRTGKEAIVLGRPSEEG